MIPARLYISHESSTRKVGVTKTTCSRCGGELEPQRIAKQRYCLSCHAMHMRLTRPKHSELPDESRKKANARAYANTCVRRGIIEVKTCEICGGEAEKHHDDYDKPKDVRWLCRPHHLEWHRIENGKAI